jgi:hypothetical protein
MANLRLRTANYPEDYQDSTAKKRGEEPSRAARREKTRRTGIGKRPVKLR